MLTGTVREQGGVSKQALCAGADLVLRCNLVVMADGATLIVS